MVTVHFADYLPKMDDAGTLGKMAGGTGGIDAYYRVVYGDRKPIKTKVRGGGGGVEEGVGGGGGGWRGGSFTGRKA